MMAKWTIRFSSWPPESDYLHYTLEKAWMKSNCIFLPGDFISCDLLGVREHTERIDSNHKTRKLLDLFDLFNMGNVVDEPTRVTLTTQSLNWLDCDD